MMKTYRKSFSLFIFALLFLTLLNNANAQSQSFVQSRFVGIESEDCPSGQCIAEGDGVLHFRLKPVGELGGEVFDDTDGDKAVRFEVQFRAAIQDMTYNAGEVFIISTGTQAFGQDMAAACKINDEGVFKNNSNYSVGSPENVAPSLMKVSVATTNVVRDELVELGTAYRTYAELECKVADTDADAGLALHARTYMANSIWDFSGTTENRIVLAMADNDLRGFRLDGKTWAEDYLLNDGDSQVIVKFSKGIKTQLTEDHFTLSYTQLDRVDSVEEVVHSPGDDEVFIRYFVGTDEAILLSTDTAVILDNDDNPLAPGSFLANLAPNSGGAFITGFSRDSSSNEAAEYEARGLDVWCVDWFGPEIIASTVHKDNLCLADKFSYDCLDASDGQPFIDSVFADPDDPRNICSTEFTVIVNPITMQIKEQRNLDLRFKRNAVLETEQELFLTSIPLVSGVFRELTSLDNQIILSDTIGPKITVRSMSSRVSADNFGQYTLNFTVTADEPVNNLDDESSYQLLRVLKDGSTVVDADGSIQNTSATAAYTVEVEVQTFAPPAEEVADIFGYTLGYVAGGITDRGINRDNVMNRPIGEAGETLVDGDAFDLSRQAIASISALECAAIYPYIGQKELFIELSGAAVNSAGFLIDGQPARQIEQRGSTTEDRLSVFKVTLGEIVTDSIAVEYYQTIGTTATATARCKSSVTDDADGDGTPDIADIDPFDENKAGINTAVASANPLSSAPGESSVWYSRDTIIPGLLKREEFTYVEVKAAKPVRKKFTSEDVIAAHDYFGITDSDARLFRGNTDAGVVCPMLATAAELNLMNVKVDEHCTDVTDSLGRELPGSFVYSWVKVTADGRLASMPNNYNLRVLPEINFSGQSSYLYASPATRTITISAYTGTLSDELQIRVSSLSDKGSMIATTETTLTMSGIVASLDFDIRSLSAGETVTYWLDETPNVWQPKRDVFAPKSGGHTLESMSSAIGSNNHVDIKISESDQSITRIHQILLYDGINTGDPADTVQAIAVVPGRTYHAVADYTTNMANIDISVNAMLAQGDYEIQTTATSAADLAVITAALIGNGYDVITFIMDDSSTTGTITVGWEQIGGLQNIEANYLIRTSLPDTNLVGIYTVVTDTDKDRIDFSVEPNIGSLPDSNNEQLYIPDADDMTSDFDYLTTYSSRPLYISNSGLIMVGIGDFGYFPRVAYSRLGDDTKTVLGFSETGFDADSIAPVETLVTYGVREIDYAVGGTGQAVGGVVYSTFPVQSEAVGETLYLGVYNEDSDRWENLERGTVEGYVDTWYAIARPSNDEACPSDIEIYRKEHRPVGMRDLGFTASADNCIMTVITDGGPYDSGSLDGRMSAPLSVGTQIFFEQRLECAAFYPNIGQTELSFRLTSDLPVDTSRLTLMQDGNSLTAQVREGDSVGDVSILTATLAEITSDADIVATYSTENAQSVVHCLAQGITEDADFDGVADALDSKPFNPGVQIINEEVALLVGSLPALAQSNDYYSRDTVIRSLMRGDHFTYSEYDQTSGTFVMKTAPTISPLDYFGIEGANARIFRMSSDCQDILNIAVANNLNNVNLDGSCTDVSDNFAGEPVGSHGYVWAVIRNGRLASNYRSYSNVRILPELTLSGQTSYLYASPTTQSITISADVGDTNNRRVEMTRSDTSQAVSVPLMNVDTGRAEGEYHLSSEGMHPDAGQTVTHRLSESSVWSITRDAIAPRAGGHRLTGFDYAVFSHNRVDVRVAAAEEPLSYLHQILLYDVNDEANPEQVASVMSGRKYTIVADLTTNVADIRAEISPMQGDDYTIEDEVIAVAPNSDFVGGEFKSFTFTVKATEGAITVGWDSIGAMENVKASYLITEMTPEVADDDMDRIPNGSDTQQGDNKQLPVAINGSIRGGDRDVLTTDDEDRGLFISDAGLIIAISEGGTDADYSVANIQYDQLSDDTMEALGLTKEGFTTDNPIETIATFGIGNVTYAIGADDTAVGGVTYTTFPVQSAQAGKTLYLNKYDSNARMPHWKPFKRHNIAEGHSDTWYAIARPQNNRPCPTDMETYRNGHRAAGEKDMGFVASAQNCIMVVITDGGPYDNSGLDSRVVDPLSIGLELATVSDGGDGGDSGGGSVSGGGSGGGAIGGGTLLLLFALLLSLIVSTRNQSRLPRYKRQA